MPERQARRGKRECGSDDRDASVCRDPCHGFVRVCDQTMGITVGEIGNGTSPPDLADPRDEGRRRLWGQEYAFGRPWLDSSIAPIPAIPVTSIGRLNSTDPEQPFQVDAPSAPAGPVLEQTRRKIGSCYVLYAVASGRFVRNGGRPS
jgi:hypothetical protein